MRNSEESSPHQPALVISPFMEREGRYYPQGSGVSTSTSAIGIRNFGARSSVKRGPWFPPGRVIAKIVCALCVLGPGVRHFSAIRSVLWSCSGLLGGIWYHSIPIILGGWRFILFFSQVSFYSHPPSVWMFLEGLERVVMLALLICWAGMWHFGCCVL
ncbi:hypothetical protein BJY04DRAFT_182701 [Aspergillus karnatakaensis]|uniref:uncharacterized protein n=1 Tax=Aspergillus karnatakaensis TaxID=1810916 RepID=UPI003CCD4BDB